MQRCGLRAGAPLVWLAYGVLVAVAAETGRPGGADLIGPTFSELVFTERGARLVGVAMVGAAVAVASVTRTLIAQGAPVTRGNAALLAGWVGALAVAAAVPMTPVGAPFAWHDQVHRYTALAGLVCLPAATLRIGKAFAVTAGWRRLALPLRRTSWISLMALAAFVAASAVPGGAWLSPCRGITERVALATDLVLIGLLTASSMRHERCDPGSGCVSLLCRGGPRQQYGTAGTASAGTALGRARQDGA